MAAPIGIVGFGRFGRALGGLFLEAGHQVSGFDPDASIEPELRVDSLAALADASSVIVLCVPVAAIESAVAGLAPHLSPRHLVLDAGSVKLAPGVAMDAILGSRIPWVGTHPLFGPTSLALGERPLRVVVCPNETHAAAAVAARALFEGIGCQVIERSAADHDRLLAESHALTYFIAKGVLDGGFRFDPELAPPSSQAIARAVEAVRTDAGHLFATLQRENPFASEVRHRFRDALEAVDRSLEMPQESTGESAGSWRIPDLGARSPELRAVRDLIDDVDQELVALLARRAALARRAGRVKAELGAGVFDPARETDMLERRGAWADGLDLDAEDVIEVFRAVLRLSRRVQRGNEGARDDASRREV